VDPSRGGPHRPDAQHRPQLGEERGMDLPRTLHGQLYLLAYDRKLRRFEYGSGGSRKNQWRLELALRSAILTDLY
jgi:hypothetical protein